VKYSLVSTVLNDRSGVEAFFHAVYSQTRLPGEIVIVDGGSHDGTWEALELEARSPRSAVPVVVRQVIGCNVARGRNLAIEAAKGSIIVSTDIGCNWDPEWFEELVKPFEEDGGENIDVVVGSWAVLESDAKSGWARIEFARRYPFRLEATPASLGINRSIAYRRHVWEKVGGYPQDLTLAADDVVFDLMIRQPKWGFRFAAAPKVRCYWERHATLAQFAKEERRNFYGAAEAGIWMRHFVLVSGRIVFEVLSLGLGLVFLIATSWVWPAIAVIAMGLFSLLVRIRSLAPAARRLKAGGVKHRWPRLIVFEYWTKIQGMEGYWFGIWNGRRQCEQTRRRLMG
jgi:glycosyltransferase involved in cell wall biosynthesis